MTKAVSTNKALRLQIRRLEAQLRQATKATSAPRKSRHNTLTARTVSRKQTQLSTKSEVPYRTMVKSMENGAVATDRHGKILYANPGFAKMVGASQKKLTGTNIIQWLSAADSPAVRKKLSQANWRRFQMDTDLPGRKKGHPIRVHLSASSFRNDGACKACFVLTNVSETVTAERLASSILQQAAEAIIVTDSRGRIIHASNSAQRICGQDPLGKTFNDILSLHITTDPSASRVACGNRRRKLALSSILKGAIYLGVEVDYRRHDGRQFNLIAYASPLLGPKNRTLGCVLTLADITDLRRAEQARWQLASIIDSTHDAIFSRSMDCKITSWNPGAVEMFGYTSKEAIGADVAMLVPPDRMDEIAQMTDCINRGQKVIDMETVRLRKNGEKFYIAQTVSPIFDSNYRTVGLSVINRDITERRRLEAEILRITENERQSIGHDLHDSLGQSLTGLSYLSRALRQKLADKNLPEADDAAEIQELARNAIVRARALARGLSPGGMRADSLITGLAELASSTSRLSKINCTFVCDQPIEIDDSMVSMHLYRIAQESLQNAVKHADARNVEIHLAETDEAWRLSICHDGSWLSAIPDKRMSRRLQIMAYRARLLGSSLKITPRPEGGAYIECTLQKQSLEMLRMPHPPETNDNHANNSPEKS